MGVDQTKITEVMRNGWRNPYLRFEKVVAKYDKNHTWELLDLSNEVTSETASVYMEIGIQVGVLLVMDVIKNVNQ